MVEDNWSMINTINFYTNGIAKDLEIPIEKFGLTFLFIKSFV